jgi:mono/diheme cytochrome c family protein
VSLDAARMSACATLALVLLLSGCRRDMQEQPRYDPLAGTNFFGDGRSARPIVDGTVAWGRLTTEGPDPGFLRIDQARYTGKIDNQYVDYFPFPMTRADLDRGQQRFNIYCSPCHSRTGDGNGMVVQRGFKQAASYHTQRLINMPVGHFFDVITNGFGQMPSYASRVEPDDRWRIAAYIRVLQLSQDAPVDAVPAAQRSDLDKNPPTPPMVEPQPVGDQVPPNTPQKIQEPIK